MHPRLAPESAPLPCADRPFLTLTAGRPMPEPENHTLHPLREMRDESRAFRKEGRERFDGMGKRFSGVEKHLGRIESVFSRMACLQADHNGQFELSGTRSPESVRDGSAIPGFACFERGKFS